MRIGYACINSSIGCTSNRTFRLASYSSSKIREIVAENLSCLEKILKFNKENNLLFFRIGSGLVPFASHSVCRFNWSKEFKEDFKRIGDFIKNNSMRVSMHPDQFVLINALSNDIYKNSLAELNYHNKVLDLMGLGLENKIQIHIGGAYGDKEKSIKRFVDRYKKIPSLLKKRLVIENDDKIYNLKDCLAVNKEVGVPVVFDTLHHEINNNGEDLIGGLKMALDAWKDSLPIIDYSLQARGKRVGSHANSININKFSKFINSVRGLDFDIMLELKDKEKSALRAVKYI
ncbi:MAG: UV DNA damage repair endonuclease UvsE [Candidatus Portnoybacteria bacterium]|nr:UV DNA damage repair endonuclease UvsE [Candidatus Portnoybacteria bacterium]